MLLIVKGRKNNDFVLKIVNKFKMQCMSDIDIKWNDFLVILCYGVDSGSLLKVVMGPIEI